MSDEREAPTPPSALDYERTRPRATIRTRWFECAGDARRPAFWPAWWGELWPALLVIAVVAAIELSGYSRRGRPPPPFERRLAIVRLVVAIGVPTAALGAALWASAAVRVGEIFARRVMRSLIVLVAFGVGAFVYFAYLR